MQNFHTFPIYDEGISLEPHMVLAFGVHIVGKSCAASWEAQALGGGIGFRSG